MILVDTNIIIDFWKSPEQEKADIFNNNEKEMGTVKNSQE